MTIDDSMIGIVLSNGKENILILNVYLPCDFQTFDALDNYRNSLAKLKLVIEEQNVSSFIIVGDFNADPFKGRFWKELLLFCQSFSLSVVDKQLPNDTFTYLCPARNGTSWLDHILCTSNLLQNMSNVVVSYESAIYDHFPIHFNLEFCTEVSKSPTDEDIVGKLVNWSKLSVNDKKQVKSIIHYLLDVKGLLCHDLFSCTKVKCSNIKKLQHIDKVFDEMVNILMISTDKYSNDKSSSFRIIPGWND